MRNTLKNLVAVFREVRRVLRDDGTLWLNYGDSYTTGSNSPHVGKWDKSGLDGIGSARYRETLNAGVAQTMSKLGGCGLKAKNLLMMPARVAMALQADGWWLRSEIIWHKPNPMPESVTDRPTNAHEKVFLLTKSPRYFYDAEAVRVDSSEASLARYAADSPRRGRRAPETRDYEGVGGKIHGANLRNVWKIATQGVSAAHFATFPEALIEPCIRAGTSAEGACEKCGAPWERVTVSKPGRSDFRAGTDVKAGRFIGAGSKNFSDYTPPETTGWEPTCDCEAPAVPCTVLDPFVGSGTTCRVATRLNRRAIGCDLGYQEIAVKRTTNVQRMLI